MIWGVMIAMAVAASAFLFVLLLDSFDPGKLLTTAFKNKLSKRVTSTRSWRRT